MKVINARSAGKQCSVLRRGVGLLLWMRCGTGKGGGVVGLAMEVKNISKLNTEHLTNVIIRRKS